MFAEVNNEVVVTFPYDYDTLVSKNPNTRFPPEDLMTLYQGTEANLAGNELVRVVVAPEPQHDKRTQSVVQDSQPTLIDGTWMLGWSVMTLSAEEQAAQQTQQAASTRAERNRKLADSDWTQLADSTADKDAWAAYRQGLRDVPSQAGFPWDVTWPVEP